jgi:membrane glycosyltransferase
VSVTLFVIGLPFGRQVGWAAQLRDADGVPFGVALRRLWPHTLVGLAFSVWLARVAPGALWLGIGTPFALGLVGAIPLAMFTAHPAVGRALGRIGLCRIPEEVRPPAAAGSAALFRPFAAATTE